MHFCIYLLITAVAVLCSYAQGQKETTVILILLHLFSVETIEHHLIDSITN